jgi:hypothetical protein
MEHWWLLADLGGHIHPTSCIVGYWFTLVITSIPHGAFIDGYWFTLVITSIPHGAFIDGYWFTLVITSIPHGALFIDGY